MVSKALLISMNTVPTILPSFTLLLMVSMNKVAANSVERFFLNPNWQFDNKSLSSRYSENCRCTIFSITLETAGITDIGR